MFALSVLENEARKKLFSKRFLDIGEVQQTRHFEESN